ncbi:MAG: sodium:proline symporter, partial [Pseudomonadota bacterium]
ELVAIGRVSVLVVSLVAIALAFDRSSNILSLVGNAWAGFGAAFGPIILLSLYWKGLSREGALAGMVTGAVTVLFWLYAPVQINGQSLSQVIYEIIPGFILSGLAAIIVSLVAQRARQKVQDKFSEMEQSFDGVEQALF